MEENEFLISLQAGNKEAFASLVREFKSQVLNICYRFLLNKEDAEDISQDVFIEIYHSLPKFRGEAKLSTWIYRIAVSKSLEELKKRNRKKRISSLGKTLNIDLFIEWLTGSSQPDKNLEEKVAYLFLLQQLNKLPDNQRIALTLSKIEGHSNSTIAEIMKTSISSVESLIHRAKINLKTIINP